MIENVIDIYGLEEDLDDFRKFMSAEGLSEFKDGPLEAGGSSALHLQYALVWALASCIKKYMEVRGKRMVSQDEHKLEIRGYSAEKTMEILQNHSKLRIKAAAK